MRDFRKLKGISEDSIRRLRTKIFGRLSHEWTRTKFRTGFGDGWSEQNYRVLAKDDWSVALWIYKDPGGWILNEEHILHVHFEGPDYYWILVELAAGPTREWFRRVTPSASRKK